MKITAKDNLLWTDFYGTWTIPNGDFNDEFTSFFYFGGFTLLGVREPKFLRDGVELWLAHGVDDFVVHDGGACFGVELVLPHLRELTRGKTYEFGFSFRNAPDVITVNDQVCWRRDPASEGNGALIKATFYWQADGPKAAIRMLCLSPESKLDFPASDNRMYESTASAPTEPGERFALPGDVKRFPFRPLYRQWLDYNTPRAEWPAPIPEVPWPTDRIGVLIDFNGVGQYSFNGQLPYVQKWARCTEFGKHGINGIFYSLNGWPPQTTCLFREAVPGDISLADMDNFIAANGIEHVILESCQLGEWCGGNPYDFPTVGSYNPRDRLMRSIDMGIILQTRYPHIHVYYWIPEYRIPGGLNDRRNRIEAPSEAMQLLWNPGGTTQTYDLWNKWDKLLEANAVWHDKIRASLPDPARTHIAIQVSSGFTAAAAARSRADMVDTKTIHRHPVAAAVAAGRGAARHGKMRFQLELDSYVWNGYNCWEAREVEQLHRVYFASGCDSIYNQADFFAITEEGELVPNEVGLGALRAIRWIRTHPRRGEQIVPFLILQGDGCHVNVAPEVGGSQWHETRRRHERVEQEDFELLTAFLPQMGHYWRADYRHTFCGTPYGPVDIAPAEKAFNGLSSYRLAVMASWHGMTPEQYFKIGLFVAGGGTFVCALGHLRGRGEKDWEKNGRAFAVDPRDLFGVSLDENQKPFVDGAEVVLQDEAGPLVTRKGNAYLVWREVLQSFGEPANSAQIAQIVADLARKNRLVRFEPELEAMEILLTHRDGLLIATVFNHGRIGQPCGLGEDGQVFEGRIHLDRSLLAGERAGCGAAIIDEEMRLHEVGLEWEPGWVSLPITVDRFTEIVIGPGAELESRLFS